VDIQIRAARTEEQQRSFEVCEAAFSEGVNPADVDRWSRVVAPERTVIALDGENIVGTGANFTFDMTISGTKIPVAGVTMIGVLPTHRRRGILRKVMAGLHEDAARRDETVAVLWASEAGIYQRFGYGHAAGICALDAPKQRVVFHQPSRPRLMRMVELDEAVRLLPEIYDRVAQVTPGMLSRDEWRYHRLADPEHHRGGKSKKFCAVLEVDGRLEGYVLYRSEYSWEPETSSQIWVEEAMATGTDTTRDIWQFIFEIDLAERVRYPLAPTYTPLKHMVLEPGWLKLRYDDALWLRVLDVPGALDARDYAAAERIVFDLSDPGAPDNHGTWFLDTTGDNARVARSDDRPQVSLDINDLGALFLGGTTLTELLQAGRGTEHEPGAARRLDDLFRTERAPWCPEIF
jgi:predicted acetyltransferase